MIDRAFVRTPAGLIHYRSAGRRDAGAVPVYLAHSGPGSSLGLAPIIEEIGRTRFVIAPDMPGNGDSDPPQREETDIAFYVDCAIDTLDALGIDQVDFYGQHTGAHIGCELALTRPERVRRLILDGIALFPPELKAELLDRYAPRIGPDPFGGHLAWAWNFVRGLFLHFPYYAQDPAHRLHATAVPDPVVLQRLVVDLIKALPTYHLAYRAAFNHATADRLPLIRHDTLLLAAAGDPLGVYSDRAAALLPRAQMARIDRDGRGAAMLRFIQDAESARG